MRLFTKSPIIATPENALPGRKKKIEISTNHYVNGHALIPPFPDCMHMALVGLGCFWGAERKFWETNGVYSTAVGYAGGFTPNPTYEEVCTGYTGHNEVVRILFDPGIIDYKRLLKLFWEAHNPTQGLRQGNDTGTQYRSGIYTYDSEQNAIAKNSLSKYQDQLNKAGFPKITTEILPAPEFYYAEDYHQQYLAKNPGGYCGLGGTGVQCTITSI